MGILRTNKISGLETPTPVTGSVSFDGSGDWLSIADSNDWFYSTGNFTIEFWYYFNALPDSDGQYFYSQRVDGGNYVFIYADSTQGWVFDSYSSVQGPKVTASTSHTTGVWKHLAVVRNNNAFTIYIDGIGSGTSSSSSSIPDLSAILELGRWTGGPSRYVNGYISNLRILKGTALYTSNFTPPVNELQRIGDTVLLCCNNPDSAGAEATGKAITVNGNAAASTFSPGLTRDFTYGTQFQGVAKFDTQGYFVPPSGTTTQRSRGRGILAGGNTGSATNKIDYISIQSSGISQDFGDLNNAVSGPGGGVSSSTRGIIGGGIAAPSVNINNIDYVTIAVTSNAIDFGDLIEASRYLYGGSSNIRGLFGGGLTPSLSNVIQYVIIASVGNARDFGDLTSAKGETGSCSSNTRCLWGGGNPGTNVIEYVTISSTGNAQDFGDLTQARLSMTACSSPTRGVFGGGYIGSPVFSNVIDYVTISSTGNAQDFGDLTAPRFGLTSVSNSIRGVFCGGQQPSFVNTMEFVLISSTGNVSDFGDLYLVTATPVGCSDSHGGLS
jgi:hypothetical protein